MKKVILFLLAASMAVLTSACQGLELKHSVGEADKLESASLDTISPKGDNRVNVGQSFTDFIPVGWHILEAYEGEQAVAKGDLNKDGIEDIAAVIEAKNSATGEVPERALLILFGEANKSYTLSIMAEKAVLKANEGGVFGDPFESIEIDRGTVLLSFYGGSNWRWYSRYRFRYQDEDWYLIGATQGSYFNATHTIENADEIDYNLLTGDYIEKKTDKKGKSVIVKGNRGRRPLVKLKEFEGDSGEN